jgi:hypothetical protein
VALTNRLHRYFWAFLLAMFLLACDNEYDADKAAERFCDCMKSNDASRKFNEASDICFDKLIEENRYFKLWNVDMCDRELDKKISNELRDSVKLFISGFDNYTNSHCCKEVLACPDSTDLK